MSDSNNTSAIIDWSICLTMSNGDEQGAQELLMLLLQSIPSQFALIKKHYEEKNYQKLADEVHHFHGGLCYTGLPRLKMATKLLESAAKKPVDAELDATFKTFSKEITNVIEAAAKLEFLASK